MLLNNLAHFLLFGTDYACIIVSTRNTKRKESKMITFSQIYKGKHGQTCYADDPKTEALNSMWYVKAILGRPCDLEKHEDGAYTVKGFGLMPITYEGEQEA